MDENKDITIKDFILEYNNFMPKQWCEDVIKVFEFSKNSGLTYGRDTPKHIKNDTALDIPTYDTVLLDPNLVKDFVDHFYSHAWNEYSSKHSILTESYGIVSIKIQKTLLCEGYHIWHYEDGSRRYQNRLATFVLYLNDVEEGGETEFLYYPKRIKPKQGKLILWPAGYTHTHRGNPPISNEKYIVTGWLEYNRI